MLQQRDADVADDFFRQERKFEHSTRFVPCGA